ncbi:response regulator [Brevibacterium jeotgali]|uniref:Two component transcriptional regulator, LuxR family n=1 Tax=Brevibacterium jeotgali TaxID=1262550 RepID=A0A2H1L4S8_9MICO|nr:response regulator transcription factor [Brevibacterium jeotgali]TWC01488.1 LuxR family two component transcriptional regulator [Brevibacterium jeotgali]SMY11907.1 two component transcriptional regulator, LuxR family [Brevibacterium jeotgali]
MTVRIVLVDDQELVRAGLALLAARDGDIEIVGEAGDGLEGLAVVRRARPDVVLMDLRMPLVDGIAATEQISRDRELGDVRVLVLTTFDAEEDVLAAVRAGASGYLLKDVDGPGLRQAIRDVASGDSIADPSLTRILFRQASRSAHRPEMVAGLSERETEVLAEVGRGCTNAEIAATLFLSPETIRTYVSRMRAKLGARDRAQLVVLAYESGLVTPGG